MRFKLNGKTIEVIDSWEGLNFTQYLRVMKMGNDLLEGLSIITGIEYETLKKAKIAGIDKLLYAASFLNKAPVLPEKISKVGKYKLTVNKEGIFDIQFESLAQFEDMRQILNKLETGVIAQAESYPKYVAIYLQKIRDGEYDGQKAIDMVPEVMAMPALEVITAGSFFFVRLQSLLNGIPSKRLSTARHRKKSIGKRSRKRLAPTQR